LELSRNGCEATAGPANSGNEIADYKSFTFVDFHKQDLCATLEILCCARLKNLFHEKNYQLIPFMSS
jgi:hypothetical protein